jgi:hypothetical protein
VAPLVWAARLRETVPVAATVLADATVPVAATVLEAAPILDEERSPLDDCSQGPVELGDAPGSPASAVVEAAPVHLVERAVQDAAAHSLFEPRFVVVLEFLCVRWARQPAFVRKKASEAWAAWWQRLAGSLQKPAVLRLPADLLPEHSHAPVALERCGPQGRSRSAFDPL